MRSHGPHEVLTLHPFARGTHAARTRHLVEAEGVRLVLLLELDRLGARGCRRARIHAGEITAAPPRFYPAVAARPAGQLAADVGRGQRVRAQEHVRACMRMRAGVRMRESESLSGGG